MLCCQASDRDAVAALLCLLDAGISRMSREVVVGGKVALGSAAVEKSRSLFYVLFLFYSLLPLEVQKEPYIQNRSVSGVYLRGVPRFPNHIIIEQRYLPFKDGACGRRECSHPARERMVAVLCSPQIIRSGTRGKHPPLLATPLRGIRL